MNVETARRDARSARRFFAAVAAGVLLLALSQDAAGQDPASVFPPPPKESEIDNDAFLPASAAAAEKLAAGDLLFAAIRSGRDGLDAGDWTAVFENWRGALADSHAGDCVPLALDHEIGGDPALWKDPDWTHSRRTEDVAWAVLRRLQSLSPEAIAVWSERFEPVAAAELERAEKSGVALAAVERDHPATSGAVHAALALADLAFEAGRLRASQNWLERAETHARAARLGTDVLAASFAARRDAVSVLSQRGQPDTATDAWNRARGLRLLSRADLADPATPGACGTTRPRPGRGVQPGAALLSGGRAAIQTASLIHVLHLETGEVESRFEPAKLAQAAGWSLGTLRPPTQAPGWPLLPAAAGDRLLLVAGTSAPGEPNALMVLSPPPPKRTAGARPILPRLLWAIRGSERLGKDGTITAIPELEMITPFEFQPGVQVDEAAVYAQLWQREAVSGEGVRADARFSSGGDIRAWIAAFDIATGTVLWTRFLAKGVERGQKGGTLLSPAVRLSAGQPLALVGARVFAGTHLGASSLVDIADGRLAWSLKTRRRPLDADGWDGIRPAVFSGPPGLSVAPADSDFLYWLRGGPDLSGEGVFLHLPTHQGEAQSLVGADGREAVVLGRSGPRPAVSARIGPTGERVDSLYMASSELFTGSGLLLGNRVFACTNRSVYMFDRTRGLYLLDCAGFERAGLEGGEPGGNIFASGDRLGVVGACGAWIFAPEP